MSRSDNKLTIRTRALALELEGNAAEVRRAYGTLRTQLIEQFYQTMIGQTKPGKRSRANRTLELETVEAAAEKPPKTEPPEDNQPVENPAGNFVGLVICEDIYNKMYLLDEERFRRSFLNKVLDGEKLRRIYVNAASEAQLRNSVEMGSTLWRELTSAGKVAVARSD
ncbi:MAG: hypothetical protein ACLFVJ_18925 [Persicimonas sp.]